MLIKVIWTYLDLFGGEVLGAPKDIALGNPLACQLMDLDHAAESDEAHQGIWWQQTQGHLEGLLQGLEVLFFQACVHDIQKDEWGRGSALWGRKKVGRLNISLTKVEVNRAISDTTYILLHTITQ